MRILSENTQAILIDVQEGLFHHIDNYLVLENNLVRFMKGLMILDVPYIVTEQYTRGLGFTILSLKETLDSGYLPFEKMEFSCVDNQAIYAKIKETNRDNVILVGTETHVCLLQTAIDLKFRGYNPIIVEDCVASRNENDKKIAIQRLQNEGVIVTTLESIIFEMCRTSGTKRFKELLTLIK